MSNNRRLQVARCTNFKIVFTKVEKELKFSKKELLNSLPLDNPGL